MDQYSGGIEHSVMHLLYTRFWCKMMRDTGLVQFSEPVKNLLTQGMVTNIVEGTSEWKAMSKSLGNGVDPDEMIAAYGADAVRLFVLFAAPPENELGWSEAGIEGAVRFLRRVYNLVWRWRERLQDAPQGAPRDEELTIAERALRRATHRTIARVTDDFERLHFNTSIAALMELLNTLSDFTAHPTSTAGSSGNEKVESSEVMTFRTLDEKLAAGTLFAVREALEAMALMLAPMAPHAAEEMWEALGHRGGILYGSSDKAKWPRADEELARKEDLEIPVQINGKLRCRIRATPDASEEFLRGAALNDEKVRAWIEGRDVVKVIVVPRRLVNIVVK